MVVFGSKTVAVPARSFGGEVGSYFDRYSRSGGSCSKETKMQQWFLLLIVTITDSEVVGGFYQYVR